MAKEIKKKKVVKSLNSKKGKQHKQEILDMSFIKAEIEKKLKRGKSQNNPKINRTGKKHVVTGVPGFDELFERGIPKGAAVIIAGGAGSGKTIFSLQTLFYNASQGKKCFYMSFEESEEALIDHMTEFGWDPQKLIRKGNLTIKKCSPFDVTTSVEAMLEKAQGELLIDLDPVLLPKGFKPDFVVVDSLTAVASAFTNKTESYRIYIEQLFEFFKKLGSTSLLITETKQIPEIFSTTGVEEFLADGVIVFYNIRKKDTRESAIEVLKMRGERHKKKIVPLEISDCGITVYPEQEVYGKIQ